MTKKYLNLFLQNKKWILFIFIFILHLFLRFYDLENRTIFGWDQVDNAWAAKNIIVDHNFPLVGMQAKQNTGFFIGPAYYYFIAPFYWIFNLDPIASGVIAGVTSILTFLALYYIIKKLFSVDIALMAVLLHTVSFHIIDYDRIQWPVNLLTPVSIIIFYALYNILTGKPKYLMLLATAIGLSFQLNFTAIFFPLIVLFSLPFFPRSREVLIYSVFSIPLFLVWLVPIILFEIQSKAASLNSMTNYISTYYHGFHLRRILQLSGDAVIEVATLLQFKILQSLKFFIYPLFCFIYLRKNFTRKTVIMCYLITLWLIIPWFVLSTYSGEITDYYFSITRPIAIIMVSFLLIRILKIPHFMPKIALTAFLTYFTIVNIQQFFIPKYRPLSYYRKEVLKTIKEGKTIEFQHGVNKSYIYYFYTTIKGLSANSIK